MPTFAVSQGVYLQERDLTVRVNGIATSIAAMVFASDKGSTERFFISDRTNFLSQFGNPNTKISYGHHSALAFLLEGRSLWCARVINGAEFASLTYVTNREGSLSLTNTPIPSTVGLQKDYTYGAREVQAIIFDGAFVASNTVSVEVVVTGIVGNTPVNADIIAEVEYTTSSDNTLALLRTELATQIGTVAPGSVIEVMPASTVNGSNNRIIRIFSPLNVQLAVINVTVTLGISQPSATVEDLKLFDVVGVNPGSWVNNVGVRVASIDTGLPQRLKISFSNALVTGNSVVVTINGTNLSAIPFNTSNDQTLLDIATAIQTYLGGNSLAEPILIGGGTGNDREISVIAPDATADIIINNVVVTGGASQAVSTITQVVQRIPPDGTFLFEVYDISSSVTVPVEKFTVSMGLQLDGYGAQQNIAEVINKGPKRSKYIRIFQPDWSHDVVLKNTQTQITLLTYGFNGFTPTANNYINSWNLFNDRERVDIRMMVNCGVAIPAVQKEMTRIAASRQDCIAILDMPSDMQSPQDAVDYRNNLLNVNSSYAAIYTPDLYIQDTFSDRQFFIPPSGYMAAIYARTDRVTATWFAPAGLNRADLSTVILGLRYDYNLGDRDLMYPAQINYIVNMPGKGYPVWSAETLQSKASALSNINVRRLLIYMEISILNTLIYSVFEPNDSFTRQSIVDQATQFALPIKYQRGLKDFLVVSDTRNNSSNDEDEGVLNVEFLIKPIIPVKWIKLLTSITRSNASFTELLMKAA